ncbi:MAG: chemotaxis protein CheX [Candidatus Zixiibacteriota bacterium]
MNAEYINPFIESVFNVFDTMLGAEVNRGKPDVTDGNGNPRDLTALIGLSGTVKGTVALAFPVKTALNIVSRLLGMDIDTVDDTITDGLGEIVNMVAGGAKAKFSELKGPPINLSLPTIVRGSSYVVDYPTGSMWLELPFESEIGNFYLRVTLYFEK